MRRICRAAVLSTVLLAVSAPGLAAQAGGPPTVYATSDSSGTLTPVNTATRTAGPSTTLGTGLGHVVITPDATTAFVLNYRSGTLLPVDLRTKTRGTPIAVPGAASLAMAPNGQTVWVVGTAGLVPVSTATKTKGATIVVQASRVALTPNGQRAYVLSGPSVRPVDLVKRTVGAPIAVPDWPVSLAMAPNGATVYVGSDQGTLTPISTATNTRRTPIRIGPAPYSVAITPNGNTAYAVSDTLDSDTVTPVNLITGKSGPPIHVGLFPYGIAISPNGRTAYVTHDDQAGCGCSGTLTSFDTATGAVGAPIGVDSDSFATSYGIAITPAQAPTAAFTTTIARHGSATRFDGRGSRADYGTVIRYEWSFGDGTSATSTTPQVSHVYRSAGRYTAKLRVVDSVGTSSTVVYTGQNVSRNGGARAITSRTLAVG